MLEKLKNNWNRKARAAEELQHTIDELFPNQSWLVIPSQKPYGTAEAMLRANGIDPEACTPHTTQRS
jgi:phosphoglycolate phosphatase-like HAD superfamily hydrolase